jgi:hypothetical protein
MSKQYAVGSKQKKYCRLLTAYSLLNLCGSKETTPPGSGSNASTHLAKKFFSKPAKARRGRAFGPCEE